MRVRSPPGREPLRAVLRSEGLEHLATLNQGGWANGDVHLVARGGRSLVLKSYCGGSAPIRALGRYLLRRERRAYEILAGIPGIPRPEAIADPHCLLLQHVPGRRIGDDLLEARGKRIIASLRRLLENIHARGVYHLDLRNQGNILVDEDCQVWLLDFASAVVIRRRHAGARFTSALGRYVDRYGLAKWERRAGVAPGRT